MATGVNLFPAWRSTSALAGPELYVTFRVRSTLLLMMTVELLMIVTLFEAFI
jgi:hypothetical protein